MIDQILAILNIRRIPMKGNGYINYHISLLMLVKNGDVTRR